MQGDNYVKREQWERRFRRYQSWDIRVVPLVEQLTIGFHPGRDLGVVGLGPPTWGWGSMLSVETAWDFSLPPPLPLPLILCTSSAHTCSLFLPQINKILTKKNKLKREVEEIKAANTLILDF